MKVQGPPRVSVLMPCRNAESTLPAALGSILRQSHRELELVAVDDGSTDATGRLLREAARSDSRVRVVTTGGHGLVPALKRAVREAGAPILARMDADDVAHPDRLRRQVELLNRRSGIGACGTGVRYFPREQAGPGIRRYERWLNSLHEPAELRRDLLVECPLAHPTLMIRSRCLSRAGGYRDPGWPEDYDLVIRLHVEGIACANVPAPLHRWRLGPDRLSRRSDRYGPDAFRRCKVHWLKEVLLPPGRGVVVWGAGSVGKAMALELRRQEVERRAFVDVDGRKIGQHIHGMPVLAPEDLVDGAAGPEPYLLVAVGTPGARDQIRGWLEEAGYREPEDFRAVA